jgi:AraC-like DNA-binding protein
MREAASIVVGSSRCHPADPSFRLGGRFGSFCLAFPRRALWIQPEHHHAFVADSTKVTVYGPDDEFGRRAIDPAGGDADWIAFSPAIMDEATVSAFNRPYVHATASMLLANRCLHDAVQGGSRDRLFVEESAVSLLAAVLAAPRDGRAEAASAGLSRRHYELVQETCAYLNRTFKQNHSLDTIAEAVGTSVFHLCRVFKRVSGKTIHGYRNELRVRDAVVVLANSDSDLLTIALASGYSGHSHFTAAFRQTFGLTPSRFRELRRARARGLRAIE